MLEHLREVNDVPIYDVHDEKFSTYGKVITGYDTKEILNCAEKYTTIPAEGNVYVASMPEMEALPLKKELEQVFYGGMPVEIGYCNGRNSTYNGFEYHKGSEINIAVTDLMLVLSHTWIIKDNTIHVDDAEVFYSPQGTMIEMYQTTLHLSPCKVRDEGFKAIVVLPGGTNTPLTEEEKAQRDTSPDPEAKLLLQRNKWVLSHPERKPLIDQGAWPGLRGENKKLYY